MYSTKQTQITVIRCPKSAKQWMCLKEVIEKQQTQKDQFMLLDERSMLENSYGFSQWRNTFFFIIIVTLSQFCWL